MADVSSQPCIVIVRFETSDFKAYRNSIKRGKSVLQNYGGTEIALSPRAAVVRGTTPDKFGMSVLGFPSGEKAERWLQSERLIGQQDWLGGIDIICVPLHSNIDMRSDLWVVADMKIMDHSKMPVLERSFDVVEKLGGRFVARSNQVTKLRGVWSPSFLVVEQWPSIEVFKKSSESEELRTAFSSLGSSIATNTFVFEKTDVTSPAGSPRAARKH